MLPNDDRRHTRSGKDHAPGQTGADVVGVSQEISPGRFLWAAEFYEPQLKFFAEGRTHHQRLLRGGNQVGKSFSAAFEASLHMTGQYPKWWPGKKFDKPTRGWIVGVTAQLVRDGPHGS
jgi:hypothetical protein